MRMRTDFDLFSRQRLVSGGGQGDCESYPRHSHYYSGRSQTLAGCKKDSWFCHTAIEVPGEKTLNE